MAGLTTLFNVLALNLVLLVVSLPVITAPAAINAASGTSAGGWPAVDTWSLAARLAVRNLAVTGPLFLAEMAAATTLTMIDPGLLLLGLPVVLLYLTKRTARLGLRRVDLAV